MTKRTQRPIGGFFELELPEVGSGPHPEALALSTGRSCMLVILEHLRPKLVLVPYHSCAANLAPFEKAGVATRFYGLNEDLSPADLPELGDDEYLLWINYYGICEWITQDLKVRFGDRLIIDDTHAFFVQGHPGFWSFTSARKYFGVPDGAYLYGPERLEITAPRFTGISITHSALRALGKQAEAFKAFLDYEASLPCEVYAISAVSEVLLSGIDMDRVARLRRENYAYLHSSLASSNQLDLPSLGNSVPFCYPYLPSQAVDRPALYARGLFVPTLWPDAMLRGVDGFEQDKRMSRDLLPLPIDHRYSTDDLQRLAEYLIRPA